MQTYPLTKVLLVSKDGDVVAGKPYVDGAKVDAVVLEHGKAKKIVVFSSIRQRRTTERNKVIVSSIHKSKNRKHNWLII